MKVLLLLLLLDRYLVQDVAAYYACSFAIGFSPAVVVGCSANNENDDETI